MAVTARPLPRGRHRLTREQVAASQRERILRAMADVMAEKGYGATSVADVLSVARVSRETFYEQFSSKADCFGAAYEAAVQILLSRVGGAGGAELTALERFDALVGLYLDALAEEPAFARLFLVEVYAAGPAVLARRAELQKPFAQVVIELLGARDDNERFACEALVAAVSSMVTARVAAGDRDGLRELREPLVGLVASGRWPVASG